MGLHLSDGWKTVPGMAGPFSIEAVEADIKDNDAASGYQLLRKPTREPLEASNSSVIAPSPPQMTPSQVQQSVLFCHDAARPPSCDSLVRNWRRERLSCSVHEPAAETKLRSKT
ncbi:hypothetical protein E2562_035098 [Oryza meyeriana var. granulata]|uniref:Uncharacterized protein n=1 Tax=Oryza meyeriana var. granulata TaxID=110450 RepID=A0A6G1FFF8_9ORYZ|nr:hypothetical protein E2562_035098 [Oryza meyeriana var. granulata]